MQYLPAGVLSSYAPEIFPQPIMCPTIPILSLGPEDGHLRSNGLTQERAAYLDSRLHPSDGSPQFDGGIQRLSRSGLQCDRPSSQATSVKAEPGSRIGSIASASVVNKVSHFRSLWKVSALLWRDGWLLNWWQSIFRPYRNVLERT